MKEYADQIASECRRLEQVVTAGLEELDNSHALLGKPWYGIGLEDNTADQQKDSGNKRNIVLRMIDRILAFIKAIGAKVAEWYRRCKTAITKFFGKEDIDPKAVSKRFDSLAKDLSAETIDQVIASLSESEKKSLAEVVNTDYNKAFNELYNDYKHVVEKSHDIKKFVDNTSFFSGMTEKATALKALAEKNKIYENTDAIKTFLTGQSGSAVIALVSANFKEVKLISDKTTAELEKLLQQVQNYNFENETHQQATLKLITNLLTVSSDVVSKINAQMFAVSSLMGKIVKRRFKKINVIPH